MGGIGGGSALCDVTCDMKDRQREGGLVCNDNGSSL